MPFSINRVGCGCEACVRETPVIIVVAVSFPLARAWAWDNGVNPQHISVISSSWDLARLQGTRGLPYVWLAGPEDNPRFAQDADKIMDCLRERDARPWTKDGE